MSYKPFPRQQEAIDKMVTFLNSKSKKKGIFVYPTSFGKSILISNVASKFPDKYFINVTNNKELLRQNYEKFLSYGFEASLCSKSLNSNEVGRITFATIGTLAKHVNFFKDKEVIILDDECQEGSKVGSQLDKFIKGVKNCKLIGTTATPFRLSANMQGSVLKMMNRDRTCIYSSIEDIVQIQEVVADKRWTPLVYKIRSVDQQDLKLNSSGSDYTNESVKKFNESNDTISKCIREIEQLLKEGRKSILVSVPFIEDARQLEAKLDCCRAVYSGMDNKERDKVIEDFKSLKIKVVAQVQILSVGFDHVLLDALVMAKPSNSLTFVYQLLGRLVRIHPDKKDAVVIDLSGNCDKFGRIEDITIENNDYTGGWAAFSGDRLLTNYPLGNQVVPTRKSLQQSKKREEQVLFFPAEDRKTDSIEIYFGKFKGKTVKEVYKENKSYLAWLASNKEFNWYGEKGQALKKEIFEILKLEYEEPKPIAPKPSYNSPAPVKEILEQHTNKFDFNSLKDLF